jgi:secondary thiamine-phosphate synthase enzyme
MTVFVPGSTAGITNIEYEPGLLKDLPDFLEKILPSNQSYEHDNTWHDGNGYAHLRSALLKPSMTIPFADGKLLLGTWQQIILLDFDNRPRQRTVVIQLIGNRKAG